MSTLLRKAVLEVSVGLIIINNIGVFNLMERVNAKGTIKIKTNTSNKAKTHIGSRSASQCLID